MELIIYILVAILGLCVGSFLNVVIYRVPQSMSLAKPASHCPKCNQPIKWFDNIPLLSFIFLGAKCRHCKNKISIRYPLIEFLNMILWLACALFFWNISILLAILLMLTCSILLIVAMIDIDKQLIYDRFIIMLLIIGIILCIFAPDLVYYDRLIGLAVGSGILAVFYGCGWLFFKREVLGVGDIKLMGVCGLIIGWQNILLAYLIGSIVGSIILVLLQKNKSPGQEYPFAPFLVFGVIISMLIGSNIIDWYLSLIS